MMQHADYNVSYHSFAGICAAFKEIYMADPDKVKPKCFFSETFNCLKIADSGCSGDESEGRYMSRDSKCYYIQTSNAEVDWFIAREICIEKGKLGYKFIRNNTGRV